MDKDMLLMMKDKIVMSINFDLGKYEVVNERLLPFTLQGILRPPLEEKDTYSKYELTQIRIRDNKNKDAIIGWLANRVLPLSRDNAKKVYNLLRLEQRQDDYSKAKIAILCRAVSLQDNYWVKIENDKTTWDDVNLRTNKLNDVVAQVSLHGSSLSLTGSLTTPELTGQGAYAKAWKRENGELWLYKKGAKDATESRIEVMVSNILDKCNVPHIHYELGESTGGVEGTVTCCKCKCMTTEKLSILPAMDYNSYCIRHGLDFYEECKRIDADMFYKMCIVDYLIANRDRHGMNWGFYFNCDENEILHMHPLFDHNNAFDKDYMADENARYLVFDDMTLKEAAIEAMKHVDFHFTEEITRDDFITDRQFKFFVKRAKQLGIKLIEPVSTKVVESFK
ncbi:hypothetical protein [Acetivibrio ethanolgignens]|uniref:HipA-like C-terminal domain-containing protein n=1 Tax=Acetivibrio ethanolgignens TaxID=290052 RepID=A0A0V8QE51_9FIRM|nr:hypothetical protein [Acetivibrio ethanolgignens]KSV58746.1 hypothetical protein ASU35_11830 [Acetivibrio ethanolgignens]